MGRAWGCSLLAAQVGSALCGPPVQTCAPDISKSVVYADVPTLQHQEKGPDEDGGEEELACSEVTYSDTDPLHEG